MSEDLVLGASWSATCQNGPMGDAREILTWDKFGEASRELASMVWESGFRPEMIVCVARGGLIPASAMSYALDQKAILVMNVEFYTGVGTTLEKPRLIAPIPDQHSIDGKRILIVDDIADTGKTLQFVTELCAQYARESKVAVLYEKPESIIQCDYVWRQAEDWVSLPWSELPPVTGAKNKDN